MLKSMMFLLTMVNSLMAFAAPTIYEFPPNEPFNTAVTVKDTSMQCVITYPSNTKHSLKIYVLSGEVIINGTTLSKGLSMVITPTNYQVIPLTFYKGSQTQFTNISQYKMIATCG